MERRRDGEKRCKCALRRPLSVAVCLWFPFIVKIDEIPAGLIADCRISSFTLSFFTFFPFFWDQDGWGHYLKQSLFFSGHYACTSDQHVSLASLHRMMERPNLPLSPALHKGTLSTYQQARAIMYITHTYSPPHAYAHLVEWRWEDGVKC